MRPYLAGTVQAHNVQGCDQFVEVPNVVHSPKDLTRVPVWSGTVFIARRDARVAEKMPAS